MLHSTDSAGLVLYISVGGDDSRSGRTVAESYATLERARHEIRDIKESTDLPEGGVVVQLSGGTYQRDKAFSLTGDDSGTERSPIIYRAGTGESVCISGGKIVDNFTPVVEEEILARLDPEIREQIRQADLRDLGITDYGDVAHEGLQLFFNDKPMTLARWPNDGFARITNLHGGDPVDVRGTKGDKIGKFMYDGERPKRWIPEKDPWVHGYWFWDWSDERHPVESIDTDSHMISVKPPYHGYGYRVGQWFYAFNLLAEIDSPCEWYLDRESGMLYFYPPSAVEDGRAVVSVVPTAVEMDGVSFTFFEGIILEAYRSTGIKMTGGTGNRISSCVLRNLGSAVTITGGNNHLVSNCDIYEIADGGISLTGGDRVTLSPGGHSAEGNDIYNYGRWTRMNQPGIAIQGVGNRAANNRLHDAPHIGIRFSGNDHSIEFNEIYNVCYESNDAGAIYAGRDWTMRGTVIRHNYLHDIQGFEGRGCVGVYLDDMYCGTLIYGNLFYRVTKAAFIGGGRDCTIENNVFVDCEPSIHIDNRAMNWASYHVDTTMTDRLEEMPFQNSLWTARYPKLLGILEDDPAAPKGNSVRRNISIGGRWNDIHDEAGPFVSVEDNLFDVDPRLVESPPRGFALADDSPAHALGFAPIPYERIGIKR